MSEMELTLGEQCGVTFAGIKAASMFWIKDGGEADVKRYERHFLHRGVYFEKLNERDGRALLYVYNKKMLESILFEDECEKFLREEGYDYNSCEQAIALLKSRIVNRQFPHEVGLFLGYPLEDVKGFIKSPVEGVRLCGYWKVYSGAKKKADKFRQFDNCSRCIVNKLRGGKQLCEIFK